MSVVDGPAFIHGRRYMYLLELGLCEVREQLLPSPQHPLDNRHKNQMFLLHVDTVSLAGEKLKEGGRLLGGVASRYNRFEQEA